MLEMTNDPEEESLLKIRLQTSLCSSDDPCVFLDDFVSVPTDFSMKRR